MTSKIAIVSYFSTGAYDTNTVNEDEILSGILTDLGFSNDIVPWSDPQVDWSQYSTLLIKSVWDYFDYYPEFLDWLDKIKALGIPVLNDLDTIRWNSSKSYLLEIADKGFPVIAGMLLEKGKLPHVESIRAQIQKETVVIKPLVSGGAKNTFKISLSDWDSFLPKLMSLLEEEAFLVQPFVKEVAEVGEYSLIFLNGVFSHAVLKRPAKADFRVQHYFGGTIQVIEPESQLLESAKRLIREFGPNTLYARVDGVLVSGEFQLMELELIEPYLFLALTPEAIPNYIQALSDRLL
ncbi:glutathione synthetase [Algoriphagus sp.]|uniref:ATP-grasp domain-containing protein n=1 Tax=Algoriphagus sp. TaxID=1872435 RepID=UPI00262AC3E7|nr:glutathione synthetase [Algoriphagus sp.]